ncbi:3-oxoacyl-[acyl-carrier-protein] synthase III C-terminal domain-containing protein [[Clostridium] polysaccharolyticum]|jgi:3-oxoacyl-[acyl-carrier-protein] synthase-3|uniref:3-oxoacyl-[acyl-carrier-protein] synthase-3 n=1 Tax=[Clostridium] polysaccharolyticum TaxID=29364 RepID=A0A1I0CSM8_9FIRM|nr:3-oxoacyl-[acyl-carrier-protein] synthase III C-terminal domain-containing protein [[Clostridium] polysaccharolyticum]SET22786.1 3-oxoacyl-[acyl-carrier-protein] synthase-3 [[Clostridium] polysaccharolyticum]
MNSNVQIKQIAVYHPEKILDNEYYYEHYKKQGKDVKKLFEDVYGRDKRYVINENAEKKENTLTMQIEAAKRVLKKACLQGEDIDMIVSASQIPEHVVPACAVIIHREIEGKMDSICYDFNANCISMVLALENVYRYMDNNPKVNRVLLVGGEYTTQVHNPMNEYGYGLFGDAACAIILEKTDRKCGLADCDFFINDKYYDKMIFPHCGMSKIYESTKEAILSTMEPVSCDLDEVERKLKGILRRSNLEVQDVKMFCFSQYLIRNIQTLKEDLGIKDEQCIYVGDEYGYTGVSSPFLVLDRAVEKGIVKRGDYVAFWTIGAGMQHICMLIQY